MSDNNKKLKKILDSVDELKKFIPPIHPAGFPFIIIFIVVALILSVISDFLGWVGFVLTIWCTYFFRDPERVKHDKNNILLSSADGKILFVGKSKSPPNLSDNQSKEMQKISIFMNVFDVHINRIPISGKISWLKYVPGIFLNASLDKSSEDNERMIIKIEYSKNKYVYVVQIAGLIARRIKCDLAENQSVEIGDRFGLIRFGSRVDLYFPNDFDPLVYKGQTSIAGETILADYKPLKSK